MNLPERAASFEAKGDKNCAGYGSLKVRLRRSFQLGLPRTRISRTCPIWYIMSSYLRS